MRTGASTGLLGAILTYAVLVGCGPNTPSSPDKDGAARGGGGGSSGEGGTETGESAGAESSGGDGNPGGASGSDTGGANDGGCSRDEDCDSSLPRCHSETHTCVACLPGSGDNCGDGMFCDADLLTCVTGCKSNRSCTEPQVCGASHACVDCDPDTNAPCPAGKYCTDTLTCAAGCGKFGQQCASGVCGSAHSCAHCTSDLECGGGTVCATGTCLPTCRKSEDCPTGLTCCDNHCAALDRDANHCGSCEVACGKDEFCGASNCHQASVTVVCASPTVTLLKDALPVDDAASVVIKDALTQSCPSHPTGTVMDPEASGVVNPVTGGPFSSGGNMIGSLGGPYGQKPLKYLEEKAKLTPVYVQYDDTNAAYYGRAAAAGNPDPVLAKDALSALTEDHDYFVIELLIEPASRTPYFAIYGFFAPGTSAASWYFMKKVLADPSKYPKTYYVIEWKDADGDHAPSAADTFTVKASG